ncbi:MAG: thioesterase family protein [Verrucomicrobiota bacterium]
MDSLSKIHTLDITVDESAIDMNGHVNNVAYVQWMQDVAISHYEALDWKEKTQELGATWVAHSHCIEYKRPAFAGDELTIRTWIATMERAKTTRRYEIWKEDLLIAEGHTIWVFVDATTGRPKRFPSGFHDLAAAPDDSADSTTAA